MVEELHGANPRFLFFTFLIPIIMMTQAEILQHLGISALNAMQQQTIDAYRRYLNLVLLSPTGSGKTLAYLLPLVEEIQRAEKQAESSSATDARLAMVLVPSRELAGQTVEVIKSMRCGVRAVACYGGRPAMDEHRVLRDVLPHIIVATPGRAADHLRKGNIRGEEIATLVIDEFDKSLELGFHDEMAEVLSLLPRLQRRFLLSATDSEQIPSFVESNFKKLDFLSSEDRLSVHLVRSPEKDKLETLRALLCHIGSEPSIVFANHRESVERIAGYLSREGFSISAFHGGMEQRDRERALFRFVGGAALTLISTDLASRGLDIDDVRHVIHYHLPANEDAFTHRNGRTARWDRDGEAWVILGPEEEWEAPQEAALVQLPAAVVAPPSPLWTSLYIGRGKKDKINKVDIVGFLSHVGGLTREDVGRISVGDHWAYASVKPSCVKDLLERVKGQKIKGQKTIISLAR